MYYLFGAVNVTLTDHRPEYLKFIFIFDLQRASQHRLRDAVCAGYIARHQALELNHTHTSMYRHTHIPYSTVYNKLQLSVPEKNPSALFTDSVFLLLGYEEDATLSSACALKSIFFFGAPVCPPISQPSCLLGDI